MDLVVVHQANELALQAIKALQIDVKHAVAEIEDKTHG